MFEKNFEVGYLLDYYEDVLTEKQRDAMDLYYNEDLSLSEISEHAGITRQGVRDSIKRGEDTIINLEEKLGYVRKMMEYKEALEIISECANNIQISRNNISFHKILEENIELIIEIAKKLTSET